ncbi:uncharacterized protein LOC142227249 [Haematobia irritans]|uniref:uncharacterized protein LOC142227249 n=1 Tax=Haematobia irritans TaxID=7368 RepID=UPI003F501AD4
MCKFNNRLFVFSLLSIVVACKTKPILKHEESQETNLNFNELLALTSLLAPQDNYDLHYDQRQKGSENYRIKLDGFFVGIPQEESSSLLLLTDDILESFGGDLPSNPDKNKQQRLTDYDLENFKKSMRPYQSLEPEAGPTTSVVVEIPSPSKNGEARLYDQDFEELPRKPTSRTKSYISQFVNILKRGHRN